MIAAAATALALALAPASAPRQATLVFTAARDGDTEIYAIRADGSGLRQLTRNRARDYDPAWSRDGRRIAFVSDRDGDAEIYVMNADGSQVRQLTRNGGRGSTPAPWDEAPSWSPDGRRIVFTSKRGTGRDIYRMNADGTGLRRLTTRRAAWQENFTPAWSPDGARIAFVSNRAGFFNLELYAMRPDGTRVTRLTRIGGDPAALSDDTMPAWSPDGRWIAFVSTRAGGSDIYVMRADGRSQSRLTRTGSNALANLRPRWSPDGRRIAFHVTGAGGPDAIHVIGADGRGKRRLTLGTEPDWRPGR